MNIDIKESDFTPGSPEHVAYLQTALAEAGSRAETAAAEADAAKQRADAAEKRARDLPERIRLRRALVDTVSKAKAAVLARGGRCDADPSEDPEATDGPDVVKTMLGLLVPDFKPLKSDPLFLEGALMMAVHALKAESGEEALEGDAYDAEPTPDMPGDTGPGIAAGEPGRQDARIRSDAGEVDPFTARARMLQQTQNAWRRSAGGR